MMWDAVVIGSGFGGAMAAYQLVSAGRRVLMLERGGWVARGPQNWGPNGVGLVTPHFTAESPYDVTADGRRYRAASWHCVGLVRRPESAPTSDSATSTWFPRSSESPAQHGRSTTTLSSHSTRGPSSC